MARVKDLYTRLQEELGLPSFMNEKDVELLTKQQLDLFEGSGELETKKKGGK